MLLLHLTRQTQVTLQEVNDGLILVSTISILLKNKMCFFNRRSVDWELGKQCLTSGTLTLLSFGSRSKGSKGPKGPLFHCKMVTLEGQVFSPTASYSSKY